MKVFVEPQNYSRRPLLKKFLHRFRCFQISIMKYSIISENSVKFNKMTHSFVGKQLITERRLKITVTNIFMKLFFLDITNCYQY